MSLINIKNSDLFTNKISISILEHNIDNLNLLDILKTQNLTIEFCVKYILDSEEKYAKTEEDKDLCIKDILRWQMHIIEKDLYAFYGINKTE